MKPKKRVYPTKAVKLKRIPVIVIFHTKDGREVEVLAHKTVEVKESDGRKRKRGEHRANKGSHPGKS